MSGRPGGRRWRSGVLGLGACAAVFSLLAAGGAAARREGAPAAAAGQILVASARNLPQPPPSDLRIECPHCLRSHRFSLQGKFARQSGYRLWRCPSTGRPSVLAAWNTEGQLREPRWFLQGFRPTHVTDPLDAWLVVLRGFRYLSDELHLGGRDVWLLARQTYARKRGDCEDLSILLTDWLSASGFPARLALGKLRGEGHAWVVLESGGVDYILEATGGRGNHRRIPPRAGALTEYVPEFQVSREAVWVRTEDGWTGEYFSGRSWARSL